MAPFIITMAFFCVMCAPKGKGGAEGGTGWVLAPCILRILIRDAVIKPELIK